MLERQDEAADFINRFYAENGLSEQARRARLAEVGRNLRQRGHYEHTLEELAFGARVAWRHHAKCIGRLFWSSLDVIDCRNVRDVDEIAARTFDHLKSALRDGRIRSIISVFPPVKAGEAPPYIESVQVTQYAGYVSANDGRVIGDRQNIEATRIAMSLGWKPPGPPGPFDMLPIIMRDSHERRLIYEVPASAYKEIAIRHSELPILDRLGLRWYAVPVVSGMILTIGGIDYPCAPFNGFYMGTEIGSRDFCDPNRYDLLETAAKALGECVDDGADPFWRDRTLTTLNAAVLQSFQREGVSIVDHHAASRQYLEFDNQERAAGRQPSADWAWITPPQASAACPVFHLPMQDHDALPNFYHGHATDGQRLRPHFDYSYRPYWVKKIDEAKRSFWQWRRKRS